MAELKFWLSLGLFVVVLIFILVAFLLKKHNSRRSHNPLEKEIPRGAVLDMYYNPEENYVQRFVKSIVSQIFFFGVIYFMIIGIFLYVV